MNKSESIENLAKALAKFQSEITNPTNSADNPYFKSKYAPLNEILNLVRPLLSKNGLTVVQAPAGDGSNITITTLLMHESGEWIEPEPLILKADKATAQGAGSAITYARRYALSAILGISSEDDDDGNHASDLDKNKGGKNKQTTTEHTGKAGQYACGGCGLAINEKVQSFSMKQFKKPLCMNCQKQEAMNQGDK